MIVDEVTETLQTGHLSKVTQLVCIMARMGPQEDWLQNPGT